VWNNVDFDWLNNHYPSLKLQPDGSLVGKLTFQFLRSGSAYFIDPSPELIENSRAKDYLYICDSYQIRIAWLKANEWPAAFELKGRLAAVAAKRNLQLIDMHQFNSGALCLAAPMAIDVHFQEQIELSEYVQVFLIPYLAAQSFFEKEGVWLWGELHHGSLGLIQWLGRNTGYTDADIVATYSRVSDQKDGDTIMQAIAKRPRGHHLCICGSGKKFRVCHPDMLYGLALLRRGLLNDCY
jgi:hypothetical protein